MEERRRSYDPHHRRPRAAAADAFPAREHHPHGSVCTARRNRASAMRARVADSFAFADAGTITPAAPCETAFVQPPASFRSFL